MPSNSAHGPSAGSVAGIGRYDDNSHDYSDTITSTLQHRSERGAAAPDRGLAGPPGRVQAHRRSDVDAVFVAARPVPGTGHPPATAVPSRRRSPIYATSHAWTGSFQQTRARTCGGIMLADIPWLLSNSTGDLDTRARIYRPKPAEERLRLRTALCDGNGRIPPGAPPAAPAEQSPRVTGWQHRQSTWTKPTRSTASSSVLLDQQPRILGYAPRLDLQSAEQQTAPGTGGLSQAPAS